MENNKGKFYTETYKTDMVVKIKFNKSGIIMVLPLYITDGNIVRFQSYITRTYDFNQLKHDWIDGKISDEELVLAYVYNESSLHLVMENFCRGNGNLDLIQILNYNIEV